MTFYLHHDEEVACTCCFLYYFLLKIWLGFREEGRAVADRGECFRIHFILNVTKYQQQHLEGIQHCSRLYISANLLLVKVIRHLTMTRITRPGSLVWLTGAVHCHWRLEGWRFSWLSSRAWRTWRGRAGCSPGRTSPRPPRWPGYRRGRGSHQRPGGRPGWDLETGERCYNVLQ